MKNPETKDLGVFDFKEEDEVPDNFPQWSKFSNPKIDDPAITKYQFLQFASAAPITQMKDVPSVEHVHVVAIDDGDDHEFISGIPHDPLDLLENVGSKPSVGFGVVSDKTFQQHCHFVEDSINTKSFSPDMEIKASSHLRCSSGDDPKCSSIPQSPSSNGSADAGTSDGHGSIQHSSPSTHASPMDENCVPRDSKADDQLVNDLEVVREDTVLLDADYITYHDKYFPAPFILISKDSIKMEGLSLEEQSNALRSEWDIADVVKIESHWTRVACVAKVRFSLLTRDAERAEKTQGTSAVEVLEFSVQDFDWPQRQELIMSLNVRYKGAWSVRMNGESCDGDGFPSETSECCSDPYFPIFEESFEEVVYPKGDVDAVSISKRDVDLLQPEIFINDTIIDFYAKYLKNEIPDQERHRFHFFNSFFFRKLADLDKNPTSAFESKAAFQRVRKWTRKVNIFEKDYIFIPVNYSLHWSLIVICHPGEVANVRNESMDESLKVPCILHMDSIRGNHAGLKDIIQSYLLEEWNERQKEASVEIDSKFLNLRFLSLELPQQDNLSDCGLFLLHYAERFIAEAPVNFSPFMINKFENFLTPDWFVPAEASLKRGHIQRLIYSLLECHSQGSASPSCDHELLPSAVREINENDNGIEIISEKRSPGKCWNGDLIFSESFPGMEMGLLDDVSPYRNSQCINESSPGLKDLLERRQHYDQAASFGQLGTALSSIREEVEEVDDQDITCSTLGQAQLQSIDGMVSGACHDGYSSIDYREGFDWNTELSDEADCDGSNHSSDESEEMRINECDPERQGASSGANEHVGESKENVDSLTESYASASSDMMETPPEDSQEFDKFYGSNNQEDPLVPNPEEALQPSQQEENINDNRDSPFVDEQMVAEDSSSDLDEEEQAAKRIRLTPLHDEERHDEERHDEEESGFVTTLAKDL